MKSEARSVHIRKEALFAMLAAAIETFPKECVGHIFGYAPARKRRHHTVTNAIAVQEVAYRKNDGVSQSDHSDKQLSAIFHKASALYPILGSFHSHPEGRKKIRNVFELEELGEISKQDKKSMRKCKEEVAIIITISSKKRILGKWQSSRIEDDGWIEGRLWKYNFYITAYARHRKKTITQIRIFAPEAIRALNRAQKKIKTRKK